MTFYQYNKKYQLGFKLISISIPLLIVIVLEIVLRLLHYGYDTSLFIEDSKRPGFIQNNPFISNRFFTNLNDAPASYTQVFKKKKSPNTFRVFVLGESSALGFPYTHRGSFPRMLQYRLDKGFSEKEFELINLSITAINSYTLQTFTDEIINMDPDAILIYTGHNEYYGALGAGSSNRIGYNTSIIRLVIYFKQFRVVQLAFSLAGKLKEAYSLKTQKADVGLMKKMAGEQGIEFGSTIYNRGLKQFESNMDNMLRKYHKHHIPVFLSNIVSNEKGQKPFISKLSSSTDTVKFMKEYRLGLEWYKKKDIENAKNYFLKANQIDSSYAMNRFLLGEVLYERGDFSNAKKNYSSAKELDVLRFRGPRAINEIINKLSNKYNNVHFVDTQGKFVENSLNGILDNHLFIDHLHPNISGNLLIADAFYENLQSVISLGKNPSKIDEDNIKKEIPVTAVDSAYGSLVILFMKEEWPFYEPVLYDKNKPKSYPEHLAVMIFLKQLDWEQAMDSLYRFYLGKGNVFEAVKILKEINYEHPYEWKILSGIGKVYLDTHNYDEALYYYKKAFNYNNSLDLARKVVLVLVQLDNLEATFAYLDYILKNDTSDRLSIQIKKCAEEIIYLKKKLVEEPRNINVTNSLSNSYLYLPNLEVARNYIEKSLDINANDITALRLKQKLNQLENIGTQH